MLALWAVAQAGGDVDGPATVLPDGQRQERAGMAGIEYKG